MHHLQCTISVCVVHSVEAMHFYARTHRRGSSQRSLRRQRLGSARDKSMLWTWLASLPLSACVVSCAQRAASLAPQPLASALPKSVANTFNCLRRALCFVDLGGV